MKKFCLVNEPWIRVITQNAELKEVSLLELFENAHLYQDLAGEMPLQNIAVMRFLLAIMHTVFSRYDNEGAESQIEDAEEALERYCQLWNQERFCITPFESYLKAWEDRFWLVHPQYPFYQVNSSNGSRIGTECTAAKLNGELFESNNKVKLFSSKSGRSKTELTLPEASRWLLFLNAFDDCAAKNPSPKECWVSKLGITIVKGKNLFESLLMNFVAIREDGECWGDSTPDWERSREKSLPLQEIHWPDNLAELFSLRSRNIKLDVSEESVVTKYQIAAGDYFEAKNYFLEPMTVWQYNPSKKDELEYWRPRKYSVGKNAWREFPTLLALDTQGHFSGVLKWVKYLQSEDVAILSKERKVRIEICSIYYGSQSCGIDNVVQDSLTFSCALFDDMSRKWQLLIQEMIAITDQAAGVLVRLAKDINTAMIGNESENARNKAGNDAEEMFFFEVDLSFREWLLGLKLNDTEMESAKNQWMMELKRTVISCAQKIVSDAGETAFVGRIVSIDMKKSDSKRHFSTPEAYNKFQWNINKLLGTIGKG